MKFPLKEPLSARYIYVSATNTVHVFLPIVSGTSIGLDNTCKAVHSLQAFFGREDSNNLKVGIKHELLTYQKALKSDINISILGGHLALAEQKQERLAQIEAYLKVVAVIKDHPELDCLKAELSIYPRPLEALIKDKKTSNLYGMILRPTDQDGHIRLEGSEPVFSVAHMSIVRDIHDTSSSL